MKSIDIMRKAYCQNCHNRIGWVGLVISVLIGGFTIIIGILTNSKALIAASLCSGIDVATALTVLLGLKYSGKPIDLEHPYGHGKFEFLAVGGISTLLMVSACILLFHSARSIYQHEQGPVQLITLAVAVVAATATEIKYRYAKCVGRQYNSPAILSHAEHARVDVFSFAAVGIGVICARIGIHFVDPLIAIFEIAHIFSASFKMLKQSTKGLMDVSLSETKTFEIKKMVTEVKDVQGINFLFARQLGQHIWIEVSIFIDPDITIWEGKTIAQRVESNIIEKLNHVGNVQVQFLPKAA